MSETSVTGKYSGSSGWQKRGRLNLGVIWYVYKWWYESQESQRTMKEPANNNHPLMLMVAAAREDMVDIMDEDGVAKELDGSGAELSFTTKKRRTC